MRKYALILFIFFSISLYSVGLPHAVYFQVYSIQNGKTVYPDSIQFTSWITDREDEILTEKSFGCGFYKDHSLAAVQVGNFPTPWKAGELLNIEVNSNLGCAFRTIELDNSSAQYFLLNYNGDNGLPLKKTKIEKKSPQIKITPNPFTDKVEIILQNAKKSELFIERNGKQYKKIMIKKSKTTIDTKAFPAGIYFFNINIGDKIYKNKLVKI